MTNKPQVTQADIAWLRDCHQAARRQGLQSAQRKFERLIAVCEQTHREQSTTALRSQSAGEDECRLLLLKAHQRIEEIQRVCMDYLPPDSGISPNDALSDVIGLTDSKDYLDERFKIQTYLGILPTPPAQGDDHDQ